MDLPEIEDIKRIDLRPGDVIVVRFKERIGLDVADRIAHRLREAFPGDNKIVLLDRGASIDVLNEAELGGWV